MTSGVRLSPSKGLEESRRSNSDFFWWIYKSDYNIQWNSSNIIKLKSHRWLLYLCNWTNKSQIIRVLSSIYMYLLKIYYILSSRVLALIFIRSLFPIFQNTVTKQSINMIWFSVILTKYTLLWPSCCVKNCWTGTYFAALVTDVAQKYLCQFLLLAEWAVTNEKLYPSIQVHEVKVNLKTTLCLVLYETSVFT